MSIQSIGNGCDLSNKPSSRRPFHLIRKEEPINHFPRSTDPEEDQFKRKSSSAYTERADPSDSRDSLSEAIKKVFCIGPKTSSNNDCKIPDKGAGYPSSVNSSNTGSPFDHPSSSNSVSPNGVGRPDSPTLGDYSKTYSNSDCKIPDKGAGYSSSVNSSNPVSPLLSPLVHSSSSSSASSVSSASDAFRYENFLENNRSSKDTIPRFPTPPSSPKKESCSVLSTPDSGKLRGPGGLNIYNIPNVGSSSSISSGVRNFSLPLPLGNTSSHPASPTKLSRSSTLKSIDSVVEGSNSGVSTPKNMRRPSRKRGKTIGSLPAQERSYSPFPYAKSSVSKSTTSLLTVPATPTKRTNSPGGDSFGTIKPGLKIPDNSYPGSPLTVGSHWSSSSSPSTVKAKRKSSLSAKIKHLGAQALSRIKIMKR